MTLVAERIPSAPRYYVSDDGRVFSTHIRADGSSLREIAQNPNTQGYMAVKMTVDGRKVTRAVHTVVAEAWHGRCPPGLEVRHLDGDKLNNNKSNLRYGTKSENCQDTVDHGRVYTQKLGREDVVEIKRLIRGGKHKMPEIARMYGVTDGAIYHIRRGVTWKHVA